MDQTFNRQTVKFPCPAAVKLFRTVLVASLFMIIPAGVKSQYLKRSVSLVKEKKMELTTPAAHYKPMFGSGDDSSSIIRGISRYGNLIIDSLGASNNVSYPDEEHVLFILSGTGILNYGQEKMPVSKNDFLYIPAGTRFGFSNPRGKALSIMVMGYKIFPGTSVKPTPRLLIANTDEVPFQVLASHGPTTQFELLMGTTESKRDRLSAAYQVTSLFIMDFAAGGTNIPHKHDSEEEIYFIMRGVGDIVAGESTDGTKLRHPSKEGDAYFFSPNTFIGFYSGNKEGEEHARILAVRFKYPVQKRDPVLK
jgi:mannose-6-phosphate isomerase-like protein (cupin superfamily)